jgi:hypothetical protein
MAEGVTIELAGWDQLVASVDGPIAEKLRDPSEVQLAAARTLSILIKMKAPKVSGRLAGSFGARLAGGEGDTPQSGLAVSEIVYAGVINYGWPAHNIWPAKFIEGALYSGEDDVRKAFEQYVQETMDEMRGA